MYPIQSTDSTLRTVVGIVVVGSRIEVKVMVRLEARFSFRQVRFPFDQVEPVAI
jgi:hypothetical protein